jgi:glutaredoxin
VLDGPIYIILGRKNCEWCDKARVLLSLHKLEYEYIDVRHPDNKTILDWCHEKGIRTVPQIFLNGELLGGYEVLAARLGQPPAPETI